MDRLEGLAEPSARKTLARAAMAGDGFLLPLSLEVLDRALVLLRRRRPGLVIVVLGLVLGCGAPEAPPGGRQGPPPDPSPASPELTLAEVGALRHDRDFFTLRDRLGDHAGGATLPVLVARALVGHAFNRADASNDAIAAALARPDLPDTLDRQLREIESSNHLRRHDYARALAAADALIERHEERVEHVLLEDIRNLRKILAALADAPPQVMRTDGPSVFPLRRGRIPVTVGDSTRDYVFDTGANLSTLMRSEAEALGLEIRPVGLDVGTSTDVRITADVALAPSLRIGGMEFRHAAFLVVDDAALTFGDFRIPGIIGFPIIEAMGEIRLRPTGGVEVPATPPPRLVRNLALDGFTPLTEAVWEGAELICRLDTGAGDTDFYHPFYRRFRSTLEAGGTPKTRRMGGAGGVRELPVLELPRMVLSLGDTTVVLDTVDILTIPITRTEEDDYLDCNIGHDVLDQFTEYIINFRDMSFLLR